MSPLDLTGWDFGTQPDYRAPAADIHHGDCLKVLTGLPADSLDACITDPPYHLLSIVKRFGSATAAPAQFGTDGAFSRASKGFMGKVWDGGDIAMRPETWAAVARVLKPGAHMACFGGTRTFHRMACAIEDAGLEIRDCLMWVYGQGMPKSHKVKATPGWGTGLKPAWEPIILARKPLVGTVAANVARFGTGAINIEGCRVPIGEELVGAGSKNLASWRRAEGRRDLPEKPPAVREAGLGRWPANLLHDGSDEVLAAFAAFGEKPSCMSGSSARPEGRILGGRHGQGNLPMDSGTAARFFYTARGDEPSAERRYTERGSTNFAALPGARRTDTGPMSRLFYCAKASKADRAGSEHPTVKPIALLRYLCRLITPPGGTILDPFAGSGTLGQAAREEGFQSRLIEAEADYIADIVRRMGAA